MGSSHRRQCKTPELMSLTCRVLRLPIMQLESSQDLGNLYHVIYTDIPDIGIFHVALWDMCEGFSWT